MGNLEDYSHCLNLKAEGSMSTKEELVFEPICLCMFVGFLRKTLNFLKAKSGKKSSIKPSAV